MYIKQNTNTNIHIYILSKTRNLKGSNQLPKTLPQIMHTNDTSTNYPTTE